MTSNAAINAWLLCSCWAQMVDLTEAAQPAEEAPAGGGPRPRKKRKLQKLAAAAASAVGGFFNVYGADVRLHRPAQADTMAGHVCRGAPGSACGLTLSMLCACTFLQAKAEVRLNYAQAIRMPDVQGLLLWVLGEGANPTWAFVQVPLFDTLASSALICAARTHQKTGQLSI
jgi:hypothetical protein